MENPTFNLQPLLNSLFQTVPIWGLALVAVNYWWKKSKETVDQLNHRLLTIEKDVAEIKLSIATQGVSNLAENIEELKESRVEQKMKIEALFRIIDGWKPLITEGLKNASEH